MKRSEPKLIGDILREFFERPYVARRIAEGKLPQYWKEIVGEHIAAITTEFRYERGILYIGIASGVARQEMFFRRDELMVRLNQRAGAQIVNSIIIR
jgi:predicted nucleic acid-binding Zn ribbon protein